MTSILLINFYNFNTYICHILPHKESDPFTGYSNIVNIIYNALVLTKNISIMKKKLNLSTGIVLITIAITSLFNCSMDKPQFTKDNGTNFKLELIINGLKEVKGNNWYFIKLYPKGGSGPIDLTTGAFDKNSPPPFVKLKNGKLTLEGYLPRPGLHVLASTKIMKDFTFMLDTGYQRIEVNYNDIIKRRHLWEPGPFNYSGSKLNDELFKFWKRPDVKHFLDEDKKLKIWFDSERKRIQLLSTQKDKNMDSLTNLFETGQNLQAYNEEILKTEKHKILNSRNEKITKLKTLKRDATLQFLKENPNSYVAFDYLLAYAYLSGPERPNYENMGIYMPLLGDKLRNTEDYKAMQIKYIMEKNLRKGEEAPVFDLPSSLGDTVRLSDFKGNITLVEFWESTCEYCKKEKQNILELYSKYYEHDFDVLSVSFDTDKKAWRGYLDKDALPWSQVIDTTGYESSKIIEGYAKPPIPFYFLLDKEGRMVAKNLRQPDVANSDRYNLNLQLEKVFGF